MLIKPELQEEYNAYVEKNSHNFYSKEIVDYGERWANLMEASLLAGLSSVYDLAEKTSHEANTEGITGFMYGCAVWALSKYWIHGESLQKWHNSQYGVKDSTGVVNPAILVVKEPDATK